VLKVRLAVTVCFGIVGYSEIGDVEVGLVRFYVPDSDLK
jgi:hypothetical protein